MNEIFIFYPTLADAQADTNAFTPATALVFQNRTVTTDTVWARAISTDGCYRIAEITLTVSTTGIPASFQRNFTECDDFLDINGNDTANNDDTDGITTFDFSSVTSTIEALFPVSQQLVITYYRNQTDALAETNAIPDTSNYRNIGYPNTQTIWIRVDSNLDNDCLGFGHHITLTVDPTANAVADLILCDDDSDGSAQNGFVQVFDLDSQTLDILGTQNPSQFSVTYHTSANDASTGQNAISTTSAYTNTIANLQTIFVRVEDNTDGCFTDQSTFDLIVNPQPIPFPVDPLEVCDTDLDGFASFDLSLKDDEIINGQVDVDISYHLTLNDANNNTNALTSPFINTVANSQTIYTRLINLNTGCITTLVQLDLIAKDCTDTDNDSIPDVDEDINENGNLDDDDTDADMTPNYLDDDDDGDGVLTIDEDYNNNGDVTDDDINMNNIPDYLDDAATLGNIAIESFGFEVYPNPSQDFLSLKFFDSSIVNLEVIIYSLNGRIIQRFNPRIDNQKGAIDISTINNGIYFLKINSENKIAVKKIIVGNN
jgi:hypothetical protein